jgi:putative ABC transport system permease protein
MGSWVQPQLPPMLGLPMLTGRLDALADRANCLISQTTATALFGVANPTGRAIRVDNNVDVRVGGVFADIPTGSTFHEVGIFLAWDKAADEMPWMKDYTRDWGAAGFNIFVQLGENADLQHINQNLKDIQAQYAPTKGQTIFLQPMREWHLYSEFANGLASGGRIRLVQLITQFLGEAALMTLAATILALGIAQIALPFFNQLAGKSLTIPWTRPQFAITILVFIIITSVLAGSYPAFYLSSFRPINILRGRLVPTHALTIPRKILVVLQFTVSISLIIGTTLVARQINFAKDRPVGYSRTGLLNIGKNTKDLYDANFQALRNDLLQTGMVAEMAETSAALTEAPYASAGYLSWEGAGPNAKPSVASLGVTADYGHAIGWQLMAGRDFNPALKTDSSTIIINEAAAKLIGFAEPVGKQVRVGSRPVTIIGVVRDVVMNSPFQQVQPADYELASDKQLNDILIRIEPGRSMHSALPEIQQVLRKYNPESPFDYRFVDTDYAQKFSDEERVAALATVFTILAIFISCLGLFGLAAYSAEQRTKEIGVRKVLGSSGFRIWRLLTSDILRLVALAAAIAIPLSGLFMHKWLLNYTYRIKAGWDVFLLSGGLTLLIAVAAVSYHAVRAAHSNPVKALRSE